MAVRGLVLALFAVFCCIPSMGLPAEVGTGCVETVDCQPPMGWRSWNTFAEDVSQDLMQAAMDAMVQERSGSSLLQLGYNDVGLDDNYQLCGSGVNQSFHAWTEDGTKLVNVINTETFPDLEAMNDYAHEKGLRSGFYENNCICEEKGQFFGEAIDAHYRGDAWDVYQYGFDSVKLDGCGQFMNLTQFQEEFNATGKYYLIENCHWGRTVPTHDWCPWSYFRTSVDIKPIWTSMLYNLQTMRRFLTLERPLSRPGCWAYGDMLEVGNLASFVEDRSHFGAWCVTSNPLILGHNITDDSTNDRLWEIVANEEAIAVNQAWHGHPGTLGVQWRRQGAGLWTEASVPREEEAQRFPPEGEAIPSFELAQLWAKPLGDGAVAVFVVNAAGGAASNLTVALEDIPFIENPDATFALRDIWAHANGGSVQGSLLLPKLDAHDSVFYTLTPLE